MNKKYVLTFDIDWAPDFMISYCLNFLEQANVRGTFFATHPTLINTEIINKGHILGIHPNFLSYDSKGKEPKAIIEECLSYAPDAWCIRMHSLFQSSPLLHNIFQNFPQLKLDVSLLMHRSKYAHKCYWDYKGVSFERLLYNWEDDAEFCHQRFGSKEELFFGDLTVLNFHPVHVFLNSTNGREYESLKEKCRGKSFQNVDFQTAKILQNNGVGVRSHLERILTSKKICLTLDQL